MQTETGMNLGPLKHRLRPYLRLVRLDDPAWVALFLWPLLWSLWIAAQGVPPLGPSLLVVLAWLLVASAVVAIGVWAEPPAPAGGTLPDARASLSFALVLLIGGLALLGGLDRAALWLALSGLGAALLYLPLRRRSNLAQLVLALAYGVSVPALFSGLGLELSRLTWLLHVVSVLWAAALLTQLAAANRERDLARGLKSTALLFGDGAWMLGGVFLGLMYAALLLLGRGELGGAYTAAVLGAAAVSGYALVSGRGPAARLQSVIRLQNAAAALLWLGLAIALGGES